MASSSTATASGSRPPQSGARRFSGNLFANVVCCSGAKTPTATVVAEVDLTGKTVHEISSGLTDRDHTSLAADSGGHWVLYLAGSDLVASADASAPTIVSTAGFVAADW